MLVLTRENLFLAKLKSDIGLHISCFFSKAFISIKDEEISELKKVNIKFPIPFNFQTNYLIPTIKDKNKHGRWVFPGEDSFRFNKENLVSAFGLKIYSASKRRYVYKSFKNIYPFQHKNKMLKSFFSFLRESIEDFFNKKDRLDYDEISRGFVIDIFVEFFSLKSVEDILDKINSENYENFIHAKTRNIELHKDIFRSLTELDIDIPRQKYIRKNLILLPSKFSTKKVAFLQSLFFEFDETF